MRIAYYCTAVNVIGVCFYRIAGRIGQGDNIAEAVEMEVIVPGGQANVLKMGVWELNSAWNK